MGQRALQVFDGLTAQTRSGNRSRELLKDPTVSHDPEWHMAVPSCFNDALDIKLNCGTENKGWTQSGCFSFKAADILYDCKEAYSEPWSDAMHHIGFSLQIVSASPAGQGDGSGRFSGSVTFTFFTPDADRSRLLPRGRHAMTQDAFVRFLIAGPDEEFNSKILKSLSCESRDK